MAASIQVSQYLFPKLFFDCFSPRLARRSSWPSLACFCRIKNNAWAWIEFHSFAVRVVDISVSSGTTLLRKSLFYSFVTISGCSPTFHHFLNEIFLGFIAGQFHGTFQTNAPASSQITNILINNMLRGNYVLVWYGARINEQTFK